jgi:GxxExxY protein
MTSAYLHPELTRRILRCAFNVHSRLGPGLLESVYRVCLQHEMKRDNLHVRAELAVPVEYRGAKLETGFRCDLLVEEFVLVELKAVQQLLPIHEAQVMTYLRLAHVNIGLLLNFNVVSLKNGIRRVIWQEGYHRRGGSTP